MNHTVKLIEYSIVSFFLSITGRIHSTKEQTDLQGGQDPSGQLLVAAARCQCLWLLFIDLVSFALLDVYGLIAAGTDHVLPD